MASVLVLSACSGTVATDGAETVTPASSPAGPPVGTADRTAEPGPDEERALEESWDAVDGVRAVAYNREGELSDYATGDALAAIEHLLASEDEADVSARGRPVDLARDAVPLLNESPPKVELAICEDRRGIEVDLGDSTELTEAPDVVIQRYVTEKSPDGRWRVAVVSTDVADCR